MAQYRAPVLSEAGAPMPFAYAKLLEGAVRQSLQAGTANVDIAGDLTVLFSNQDGPPRRNTL